MGAAVGNGTFTQAGGDFIGVKWNSTGPLDLGTNLVAQAGFMDFNVFAAVDGAPQGWDYFTLITNYGTDFDPGNDLLMLTSMTASGIAVVPLPAAAWAGLGLLGAMGVRRRMSR